MTAFNDDSKEKKDDIGTMSMADLLGMSGAEGDGRVQERDDEPGSGIAKLAQMVATSSVLDAKRPSLMPIGSNHPPGAAPTSTMPAVSQSVPPMSGSMPGSIPAPAGSVPPQAGVPYAGGAPVPSAPPGSLPYAATMAMPAATVPMQMQGASPYAGSAATAAMPSMGGTAGFPMGISQPKPSSKTGLFVGIGIGAVVLAGAAFFLLKGGDEPANSEQDPQLAKLQEQLEELKAASVAAPAPSSPTPSATEPGAGTAPLAGAAPAAGETAASGTAAPSAAPTEAAPAAEPAVAPAAAPEAAADEEEDEAPAAKPGKKGWKPKKGVKAVKEPKAPKAAKEDKEEEPADTKPKSELGGLLDADVASGKKAQELPKSPSRADVKSAMQPVQSKAAKCAKYSKGTVQLKIVVTNDGRVQSSSPVGGSADQTAANCVSMIARTARFPKFKDPTFSINYPITLK